MASYTCESSVHFDKLGSGSGSRSSPSSLLPHPRDQCTTHKCIPFSPTASLTFLTFPRCGIMGVTVLTVGAGYRYYTFKKHCIISLHFLRNDSVGGCTFQKHQFTFTTFLRNNYSVNNVGHDQEFCMTDARKWHFEGRCNQNTGNYTLFIWVMCWDQRKLQTLVGKQCIQEQWIEVSVY
jgi:hypothetical protein